MVMMIVMVASRLTLQTNDVRSPPPASRMSPKATAMFLWLTKEKRSSRKVEVACAGVDDVRAPYRRAQLLPVLPYRTGTGTRTRTVLQYHRTSDRTELGDSRRSRISKWCSIVSTSLYHMHMYGLDDWTMGEHQF